MRDVIRYNVAPWYRYLRQSAPLFLLAVLRALLLLFTVHYSLITALAQPGAGFGVELNALGGKMLKHTKKIGAALPEFAGGLEVNFIQQTRGQKAWHAARGFPVVGVAVAYIDYGIDSVYGKCVSAYPNLQLRILRRKNVEWTLRGGYGFGHVTRHYDRSLGDTLNKAIGSHLNNYTHLSTDLRYRLSPHWDVQAGLHFSHLSNASFRTPNLGLNVYGAHIGVRYFPVTSQPEQMDTARPQLRNRWAVHGRLGLAFVESGPAGGPLYPTYLASLYTSRRWRGYNRLFAGVDASYHTHVEAFLKNNEILPGDERANSWKSALFAGNEFLLGRFGIVLQVGVYLKDAYLHLTPYYQKLGAHYYVVQQERGPLKEVFLTALLKTHLASAELAEFGLGFGF